MTSAARPFLQWAQQIRAGVVDHQKVVLTETTSTSTTTTVSFALQSALVSSCKVSSATSGAAPVVTVALSYTSIT